MALTLNFQFVPQSGYLHSLYVFNLNGRFFTVYSRPPVVDGDYAWPHTLVVKAVTHWIDERKSTIPAATVAELLENAPPEEVSNLLELIR